MISLRTFRNALCILRSLDMDELLAAGVTRGRKDWDAYLDDEARFFLRLDDKRQAAMWALVQGQMPVELRAA